ncbi:hypothetical protein [Pseudomonas aeruginosa]|uniref:hypothetical protein n=1 Tax=Pseudomonas aeruginosa TaxID=287 RepID=UPI000FC3F713|nr:hypothetical protein [Pseudomonas aeruginosa]MDP5541289.1 hypothetical protein [Pseudomonas aeruginosa]RUI28253.1 hypothetical protein IPC443_13200 [Pseudomonas aeruginosa]
MSEFEPPSSTEQSPLADSVTTDEAQAFANNSDQAESEFRPPSPSFQSPLLNPTIAGEIQAFENNENQDQKRRHANDIHGMRMSHSRLLLGLALVWVFVILIVVLLQGFGRWFTPFPVGFNHLSFSLSDTVVIAFITSTTATVLGLYAIAAYWLYGKPKQEKKSVTKEKKGN